MSACVKEGYLQKWSKSKKKLKSVYAKLLNNGWFQWFDSQGSTSPKRSIDVKLVSPLIAIGCVINQVPCMPKTLSQADISRAFGMPHEPHKNSEMSFFVSSDVNELKSWIDAITNILPVGAPGGAPFEVAPPPYAPSSTAGGYPAGPSAASGGLGFAGFPSVPGGYQPPPFGAPSSNPYMPMGGYPSQSPVGSYPGQLACGGYPSQSLAGSYPGQPTCGGYPGQPLTGGYPTAPQQPGAPATVYAPQNPTGYYIQDGRAPGIAVGAYGGQQPMYDKKGKPYSIVYMNGKPKKKKWKNAAMGLAAGAAGGYLAGKVFGGMGRPFGLGGGWGSWSSLSSLSWSD